MPYAVLSADGFVEDVEPTVRAAVRAAEAAGADDVILDATDTGRRDNPATDGRGALKQLRTPYTKAPLAIPDSAITMDLSEAWERLAAIMPPFVQTGKTGIQRTMDPARNRTTLVKSMLGQNAKTEKRAGHAENVDVQGLNLTPFWMYAHVKAGGDADDVDESRHRMPNLCSGSTAACRHSCLVFAGQNYAADWSIFAKFQKTEILFADPEAFGRVFYEACARHARNAPKKGFMPAVRCNVLSDIPWELVFPSLFEALPNLQFYDYTKVYGRKTPPNYDLTFSNSGGNLQNVKRQLEQGGRVAVVAHVPEWRRGSPARSIPGESEAQWKERRAVEAHRLWAARLPATCNVGGRSYPVIDGDVNDVRFLDPTPAIIALRWKDPGGQAASRAPEALRISQRTKFVVEIEDFCGLLIGAVTPSEQPDTGIQTIFSLQPLEANPSGPRVWGTRRAGYASDRSIALSRRIAR